VLACILAAATLSGAEAQMARRAGGAHDTPPTSRNLTVREIAALVKACRADDLDSVIAACSQIITLGGENSRAKSLAEAYLRRGWAHARKHETDLAIADFDNTIALDKSQFNAVAARGLVLLEQGNEEDALKDFQTVIDLRPGLPLAWVGRARIYMIRGELDRALADANKAMRVDPGFVDAYLLRADIYRRKGDIDRAIADVHKAARLQSKNGGGAVDIINKGLAALYAVRAANMLLIGATARSLDDFGEAIRLDGGNVAYRIARGFAYLAKKDSDNAIADFEETIHRDGNLAAAYVGRALARLQKGDAAGSAADFRKAAELDPNIPSTLTPAQRHMLGDSGPI
jgi:tetratricopeptide (TPR) repeat protein